MGTRTDAIPPENEFDPTTWREANRPGGWWVGISQPGHGGGLAIPGGRCTTVIGHTECCGAPLRCLCDANRPHNCQNAATSYMPCTRRDEPCR